MALFPQLPVFSQNLTLSANPSQVGAGGNTVITAAVAGGGAVPAINWSIDTSPAGFVLSPTGNNSALLTVAETAVTPDAGTIVIRGTPAGGGAAATLVLPILKHGGLLVVPVIGFEQAGASSAQSAQKFFFNFFVSRAVPFGHSGFSGTNPDQIMFGPRFRCLAMCVWRRILSK